MDNTTIIVALCELQKLAAPYSARPAARPAYSAAEVSLRSEVPTVILGHFDRCVRAGRSGIAPIRSGVCGGCHIRVPRAQYAGMRGSHELDVCDQCGAFLFAEELLAESNAIAAATTH